MIHWSRAFVPHSVWLVLVLSAGLSAVSAAQPFGRQLSRHDRFEFALIGDVPYSDEASTNYFPNMIREINQRRLKFVVHNGDFKAGATPCSDELFARCHEQFQSFKHPFIYIPGDNEWSDCGRVKAEPHDPEERLAKLRALFMPDARSLGRRPLLLTRQSENPRFAPFRENVRWVCGGVLFAGLNVPGADNNFGQPEFGVRNAANLAWLQESFSQAAREKMLAVMFIIQANPRFDLGATNKARAGFNDLLAALERETIAFKRPVVLVHGDSHNFRIDKPLFGSRSKRRIENFTRVETFGNPDVHWLRATVDWRDPQVFTFRQEIVAGNLVNHGTPSPRTAAERN